ncbi:MAG: DUF3662 and FHA domain-containing protein [Thermomicrobiales bacterium]
MKLLDRFEQSMERLLEGSAGSIFRQKMQPAEIGKALEKAMFDQKRISVRTVFVPNQYTVALHPSDYAEFASWIDGLSHQMERFLVEAASERQASVVGPIAVIFVEDAKAKRGRPGVTCAIADMRGQTPPRPRPAPAQHVPPAQATMPFRPQKQRSATFAFRAVGGSRSGEVVRLDQIETTVGRADNNSFHIGSSDVSRYHAQIKIVGGVPRLEDIGSTNGTKVNGQDVRFADLAVGDRVAFGNQVYEVITAEGDGR